MSEFAEPPALRILGSVEIRAGRGCAPVGGQKQQVFLLALLLNLNQPVPLDRLAEVVWDENPPISAIPNLRTYAASIRRALDRLDGVSIVANAGTYTISASSEQLDLARFERLSAGGRAAIARGDYAEGMRLLAEGIAICRGPVGQGLPCGHALSSRLLAVNDYRLAVMEELAGAGLFTGALAEAHRCLRLVLSEAPTRERTWGLLMRVLYRMGDVAGALSAFDQARSQLVESLGIEPGAELEELHRAILRRDTKVVCPHGATPPVQPEVLAPPAVPCQLPLPRRFAGRARHAAAVREGLLHRGAVPPIWTISGSPGIGKSALALHVAHAISAGFPDGQLYVDFKEVRGERSLGRLLTQILDELGSDIRLVEAENVGALSARFRTVTTSRRLLLLLDNVTRESQIMPLLPREPGCAVLVTSQRGLVLDHGNELKLDALDIVESLAVLEALAGTDRVRAEPQAATAIVGECHGLPLALRAVAGLLSAHPHRPLRWTSATLPDVLSQIVARYAGIDLSERFSAACEDVRGEDPDMARLVRLLAGTVSRSLTVAEAVKLLRRPAHIAERALDRLCEWNLAEHVSADRYEVAPFFRMLPPRWREASHQSVEHDA